jgi:hypothetical protein
MVVMGAINLLLVTPAMKRAGHAPAGNLSLVSRFRGLVTGEASLSLILLLSVSALTLLPPAQVPVVGLAGSAHADDVQVKLAITPGRSGINTFQIDLLSSGRPVSAQSVAMQFTPTNANLAPSQGQPVATGPGHYQLVGGFLGFPDRWQVVVLVQRPGKYDAFAYFNYTVEAPAAATSPFPWNKVSGLALLGWAITFLSTTMSVSRTWRQRLFAGPVLAIALAVTALAVYLTRAPH